MYPVYKITEEQALKILCTPEDFLNDVKAKEIKPSKLSETVSAFANASGGDIYIGIAENKANRTKEWNGFSEPEEANDIPQVLLQAHPFGNHLIFEYLECDGYDGLILHITIKKVKELVKSSSGDIYIRVNAGKQKIDSPDSLRRLEMDKGIITFENEWVEVSPQRIENSLSILSFLLNIIPSGEPKIYLENQELIKPGHAKVCGVLLFCDEPAIYLPKRSSIKIMRYKTKEDDIGREFLDGNPLTIEGDAYNLIFGAVKKTKEILEGIQKLGDGGLETIKYPDETLHEIITNAVLHRDYSIVADVQIRIFDNRVEVESPGKLPGHVTVRNILHTQSARNPSLVRLINKFPDPPNKDVGEGLDTAFRAMEILRLKKPVISELETSVLVVIRHESLGSPEEIVMEYMTRNDEITNSIARELTGIKSENSMKNVFLRLKQSNLLEPIPERRGSASAWRKAIRPTVDEE
ncbi:ATP-binding protein [Pseudomonas fulva]|uniref:ATP-binding protein n=1 Tax=Pseudomonas fulva TaxID=47880 RepID=UPI000535831E|nr:ATP-binding protein [Pseudomonas fulva]